MPVQDLYLWTVIAPRYMHCTAYVAHDDDDFRYMECTRLQVQMKQSTKSMRVRESYKKHSTEKNYRILVLSNLLLRRSRASLLKTLMETFDKIRTNRS